MVAYIYHSIYIGLTPGGDMLVCIIVAKLGEIFPRRRASTCPTRCPIIEIIGN